MHTVHASGRTTAPLSLSHSLSLSLASLLPLLLQVNSDDFAEKHGGNGNGVWDESFAAAAAARKDGTFGPAPTTSRPPPTYAVTSSR